MSRGASAPANSGDPAEGNVSPPRERPRKWVAPLGVGLVLVAAAGFGLWSRSWGEQAERDAIVVAWVVCGVAFLALLNHAIGTVRRPTRGEAWTLAGVAFVAAWSAFVRFELTSISLLTDGGTGYGRVLHGIRGFQGLAAIFRLIFAGAILDDPQRAMDTAMVVMTALSATAGPALVIAARAFGAARIGAVLAGLGLASLPIHAVIFSSDFVIGPWLPLSLLGLALLAWGVERPSIYTVAGLCLLALVPWGRPEGALVVVPMVLVGWRHFRSLAARPWMFVPLAWFSCSASAAVIRTLGGGTIPHTEAPPLEDWPTVLGEVVSREVAVPLWLLVGLLCGLFALLRKSTRRLAAVALVACLAGSVPALRSWALSDPVKSYLELFRYGAWALPWLILFAATGFAALPLWRDRRVATLAFVGVAVMMMLEPLRHREYLAREYAHDVEGPLFDALREQVPPECGLLIVDDDVGHAVLARYRWRAGHPMSVYGRRTVTGAFVESTRVFSQHLAENTGSMPDAAYLSGADEPSTCWYYYRSPRCDHGLHDEPEPECARFEASVRLTPVDSRTFDFVHPRLSPIATLPERGSFRTPDQVVTLFRVALSGPPSAD